MKNTIYTFVLSLLIGFSSSVFAADRYFATQSAAQAAFQVYSSCWYQKEGWYQACNVAAKPDKYYWAEECPSGTVADASGECTNPCNAGESSTASYYVPGYWSTGPGLGDVVQSIPYSPPVSLCDGQCRGGVVDIIPGSCAGLPDGSVSSPTAVHCDYSIVLSGSVCSGDNGDAPIFNPESDRLCANGASDYPTCTPPACANGATDYPTCTPPTNTCANGSTDWPDCGGGTETGTCNNGATDYPACTTGGSGSGSGGGSGTCANGASNYPACTTPEGGSGGSTNSKIDESGTPTGVNSDGSAALDSAGNERIKGFGDNTKVVDLPWTMTFAIHNTACSPINWSVFGRVQSIDLCPWLSKTREALAYLWYGLACLYCWKRVSSATGGVA